MIETEMRRKTTRTRRRLLGIHSGFMTYQRTGGLVFIGMKALPPKPQIIIMRVIMIALSRPRV